jgi:DNA-binding response OmpR family regulator
LERILLVGSEDPEVLDVITTLSKAGYLPLLASELQRAQEVCANDRPGLVLLSLDSSESIEEQETQSFVRQCQESYQASVLALLREVNPATPLPMQLFQDFLLLPVRPQELLLRVRFAFAKTRVTATGKSVLRFGDLSIDTERYEVLVRGRRVDLTYKEYELLKFLATHPDRVFTREELLSKVWGYDYFGGTRTVDVHIRRLRSKIEDAPHTYIDTVRNVGYRFRPAKELAHPLSR